MKKEIRLVDVITIYEDVLKFNLSELSGSEKYKIMKLLRTFKSTVEEFDKFKEEVLNKYKDTEEFKSYQEKENKDDEESKAYIDNLNKEINNILVLELQQNKEIEFDPISKDIFIKILDKTEISITEVSLLEENIVND